MKLYVGRGVGVGEGGKWGQPGMVMHLIITQPSAVFQLARIPRPPAQLVRPQALLRPDPIQCPHENAHIETSKTQQNRCGLNIFKANLICEFTCGPGAPSKLSLLE